MAENDDLAQRRARLTPEQRKRLAQRLRASNDSLQQATEGDIMHRPEDAPLRLSYAQQRHWFFWQLDPHNTAYHLSSVLRLTGKLNTEALRASLQAVMMRHESLRTTISVDAAGVPMQAIGATTTLDLIEIDVSNFPPEQRTQRAHDEAKRINAAEFNLNRGPLLRIALIRIAPEEHHLVVVMHHIVSDAWSNRIIVDEFAAFYRAHVEGQNLVLPALPIQYADYALWQRNWLEAGEKDRQLSYWRKQLGDQHPVLQMPTDHPRLATNNYRAARHSVMLPAAMAHRLQHHARSQGMTLFMVLLCGFQMLLQRYTGQEDIRVGVPVANRHRVDIEKVVGLFVNTQVLRNVMNDRMPLQAILERTRDAALDAQTYQDLPFDQLVEALQPERSLHQNPLFQTIFNHMREDYRALQQLPGLTVEEHELGEHGAQFELMLDTIEKPDGSIEARFTFAAELFERQTVERLSRQYVHLLNQLVKHPTQCLGDVNLLTDAEWSQLKNWGVNELRYASAEPVHHLIDQRAIEQPDAVALIFQDTELGYAQLNQRANQLAHRLIALGIKPERRVGIAIERSVDMIVALLATLKAGAAYVPLDPDYPRERLEYMIADSAVELILTQSHLLPHLPQPSGGATMALDAVDLTAEPVSSPCVSMHGEHLAYIIYTSGSTGIPKGTGVSHATLARHVQSAVDAYALGSNDRVLLFSTINFDAFIDQFFPALCVGASVVLRGVLLWDSETFYQEVIVNRITVADLTTAYWHVLISDFAKHDSRDYGALRQVHVGGERMPPEALSLWHEAGLSAVTLLNAYGPTEATVTATLANCNTHSSKSAAGIDSITIGSPLAGRRVYLLDRNLMPVAPGIPGELCIGGELLARGYMNQSGLTAQRFIADPFDDNGGRLYRTGDLARWRPDGQIEYVGRVDHQVKVRGFRVELGEIEAQLLLQPEVREAVVVAKEGPSGVRLIAYVSAHPEIGIDTAQLRTALGEALPDYMLPSAIVLLENLPLNANGKVDRALLPEPEFAGTDEYEAPEGDAEQALAQIWQDVLGLERIGRNANFFELGGDSILSLQIVTKAHRSGWKITPRQLFERQTVAALAQCVEPERIEVIAEYSIQSERLEDYLDANAIAALSFGNDDIEDIYPLSPTQEGMLFHSLESPGSGLYVNQISVAVDGLDVERLIKAWRQMIVRHPILRTGFLWRAGLARPLQVVFKHVDSQVVQFDWRRKEHLDSQIIAYADEELRYEFNFEDPPIRLSLIRVAENRHQLIWTKHHILLDGWGDSILISDWLRCYNGEALTPPGPDYSVYIRWLAQQDKIAAQHFWQTELGSVEGPTFLSKAINNPQDIRSGFAQLYTRLSPDETRRLQTFAQHLHITLNTFVQAAWALLLQRYTGKQTVIFGATVAGRPPSLFRADEILGLFINTIPVPVERSSELTVTEYLIALQQKNAHLRDYEHTSLADIQRWAGYSGQPLFDSIIVFENYPINAALQSDERYGLRFGEIAGKGLTGYAMDLQVVVGDSLEIEYSYDCSDFTDDFVLNLRSQMEGLMREMMMHPGRAVGELGWLGEQALDQLLLLRSDVNTRAMQHYDPVHQQIERNAEQHPDAIALLMGEQEVSYAELNARANRLAHRLIALGAAPEMRVGVAMERSLDVIVTLLAVLKSGAAYVPLDIDYPSDRLMFMIRDSAVALLVTQRQALVKHAFDDAVPKLLLETVDIAAEPVTNPAVAMHEHHLAYVIYTSGSTGLPKGVAVAHGPLSMHCQATARIYDMKPSSCELLFMSFSFDGAHERWLTALTVGAGLAVRDQELWTAEQTYDALHHYEITNAAFPPAYLRQVAEWASSRTDPPPVELYVFGGEAMPKASYDLVRQTLRPRILINGYGPTETVVTPLIWKTEASHGFDCMYVPIGRPVGERVVYVLDVDMQPVPIGIVGELYIGGYGLARGYLGRAGLTAERFVADPFDGHGGRLYRTGDLVRWMDNGNIEYIGRADQQVKIRGFRIELGEIEACIRTANSVADTAVVVHHGTGGAQLAAYVVPVDVQQEQAMRAELKQMLVQRLPEYMLPSYVISLPELPRLPSGKLDRKRLPEPEADAGDHYQAPSTLEAKVLAEIWQEVLGVERIGETDNFFALGGDSLSSLKVIARIRNLTDFKLDLKLRDLLQRPTIVGLLGLEKRSANDKSGLLTLNQPGRKSNSQSPLFCIHAGLGTVFDYQPLARQLQGIRPVHAIPCRMLADPSHRDISLLQMAQDYCLLIRSIQPQGPYYLAGWSLGGTLAALMAGLFEAWGENVAFLGLIDPYIPGTEPVLTEDWRQDFSDFIAMAIPGTSFGDLGRMLDLDRPATTNESSKQILVELLERALAIRADHQVIAGAETAGYAEMGAEELAHIFLVARHLKALSLQIDVLKPLKSHSICWWATERTVEERLALDEQIGPGTDVIELDSDHFSIVRAQSLLSDMKSLLSAGIMGCTSTEESAGV